jgi:hypothetical protein
VAEPEVNPNPNPNPEGGTPPAEDASGLKKALEAERIARREAERALKARERADDEAKVAKELKDLEGQKQYEKALEMVNARLTEAERAREEAINEKNNTLIERELASALHDLDGDPLLLDLPQVRGQFEVVKTPDGKTAVVSKDGSKAPSQFLEAMKATPKYGRFFNGSGVSGGGAQQPGKAPAGGKTLTRTAFAALDPAGQMAHVKAGGAVTD